MKRRWLTLQTGGLLLMAMAGALLAFGFFFLPSHTP